MNLRFLKFCNKNLGCYLFAFIVSITTSNYFLSLNDKSEVEQVINKLLLPEGSLVLFEKINVSPRGVQIIREYKTNISPNKIYDFYKINLYKEGWKGGGNMPYTFKGEHPVYSNLWVLEGLSSHVIIFNKNNNTGNTIFKIITRKE